MLEQEVDGRVIERTLGGEPSPTPYPSFGGV
jgi:hypothetical protein